MSVYHQVPDGKILIVDDDQSMCELVASGLSRLGFDPHWETCAQAGLEKISDEEIHVVVTDLNMGELGGLSHREASSRATRSEEHTSELQSH